MSDISREDIRKALKEKLPRQDTSSAVLILFVNTEKGWEIVFETRSETVSQPGEVSFPGGHLEKGESSLQAALREVCEEIGVETKDVEIIGEMPRERIQGGKLVKPFAGILKPDAVHKLSPSDEVADIFFVPLSFFLDNPPERYRYRMNIDHEDETLPAILRRHLSVEKPYGLTGYWDYEGHGIWGLTARILVKLLYLLKPEGEIPAGM